MATKYKIEVTYSPDDHGWYAEVYTESSGKTVWTSRVHSSKANALADANRWIDAAICFAK